MGKTEAPAAGVKKMKQPFADWRAPTPRQCAKAAEGLAQLHGMPQRRLPEETVGCGGVPTILDALVRTILSQNTTQKNSTAAMAGFIERFDNDYAAVDRAPVEEVAQSIRCGGLANVKAGRIKAIVASLAKERGEISLEHLRPLSDAAVKTALMRYPGVGPKTASCVLLFCLQRDSFAVDTHVLRISKKLGWVPGQATREQAHLHLDARVPKPLHFALHVLMVRHGKSCYACAANGRPQQAPLGACPLGE
jgi:endonuclease-3